MDNKFTAFKQLYIAEAMRKHPNNPYWMTEDQVCENLGGVDSIFGIFCLFQSVSAEAQKRICGFTMQEVSATQ